MVATASSASSNVTSPPGGGGGGGGLVASSNVTSLILKNLFGYVPETGSSSSPPDTTRNLRQCLEAIGCTVYSFVSVYVLMEFSSAKGSYPCPYVRKIEASGTIQYFVLH